MWIPARVPGKHFWRVGRFFQWKLAIARQKKLKKRIKVSAKLEVVERLSQTSSRKLAKEYGVSRTNVLRWKSQEPELRMLSGNACRLPGGGAKIIGEELRAALTEKVLYERSTQRRVTRCMIKGWATNMRANMDIDVFICPSWIDRFMSRAGFVLRECTRKPVLKDRDIIERGVLFVREIRDVIAKFSIQPSMTFNLDETAVFFDHSKHTTVHHKGAKDVPVQSFGFEKQRGTAVFCASATGEKKLPCVMIKKIPVPDEPPVAVNNDIIELRMGMSWMNAASFIEYLGYLFPDPIIPNTIRLIFD